MLDKLLAFDTKAVNWAEKFSHKTQKYFGINNFMIGKTCAKLSMVIFTITFLARSNVLALELKEIINTGSQLAIGLLMNYIFFTRKIILFDEDPVWSSLNKGIKNKEFTEAKMGRSALLLMVILLTILDNYFKGLGELHWILIWLAYIFIACTPLPPGESKIRKWINGLKAFGKQSMPVTAQRFVQNNEAPFLLHLI